jgi:serine/threonine-protein kinase PpkA
VSVAAVSRPPSVLVADAEEDWRVLMMQYVSMVWPDAGVDEEARPQAALNEGPAARYDLVLLGCNGTPAPDVDRLARLRAQPGSASFIACLDGLPDARAKLESAGVRCLARHGLSKAQVTGALQAAWQERWARLQDADRTVPLGQDAAASRAPRAFWELPKDAIRGYEVVQQVGEGGTAKVYLARRKADGLVVTVKTLDSELVADPRALKRFFEEYAIVSRLSSPLVVRIYDHGITDRHVYTVMEYLPGGDLKARMKGRLAPEQALYLTVAIGRALVAIHEAGVMHLDLKPQNVMFRSDGSLVLVDFGVSLLIDCITASHLDQTLGTPAYVSPEQVLGEPWDGRTDLYSLGALFYEMLTGQRMYAASNVADLLAKHVNDPVPRLPDDLAHYQGLLDRLVAKKPASRFGSARAMLGYVEERYGLKL